MERIGGHNRLADSRYNRVLPILTSGSILSPCFAGDAYSLCFSGRCAARRARKRPFLAQRLRLLCALPFLCYAQRTVAPLTLPFAAAASSPIPAAPCSPLPTSFSRPISVALSASWFRRRNGPILDDRAPSCSVPATSTSPSISPSAAFIPRKAAAIGPIFAAPASASVPPHPANPFGSPPSPVSDCYH